MIDRLIPCLFFCLFICLFVHSESCKGGGGGDGGRLHR